jgi:hypothetical protein
MAQGNKARASLSFIEYQDPSTAGPFDMLRMTCCEPHWVRMIPLENEAKQSVETVPA